MGGQTALNLAKEAEDLGVWEKYGVRLIGVDIKAIDKAEDREKFRQWMIRLGVPVATAKTANSFLEGKEFAQEIGFPLVIRPSFTLGGTGGGFVHDKEELDEALNRGLQASPIHEVLVERAVLGWKEFELELLRDANNNVVIICTVENFDPMGVHTGDSITVAPAMTLSDTAFQLMRNTAIRMMRDLGNFAGGCNVQFALNPKTEEIIAIEINPRVSRSSALASKATGYPIAKIAAKLAIGYALDELKNQITGTTSAYFEPVQDYVIVKVPRWNFDKFKGANDTLGLQMKSVGEVMAIGRSFTEAVQKACQSLENNAVGLGYYGKSLMHAEELLEYIKTPKWDRIFRIKDALMAGISVGTISKATNGIDRWFLYEIQKICNMEKELAKYKIDTLPLNLLAGSQAAWVQRRCKSSGSWARMATARKKPCTKSGKQPALPGSTKWSTPAQRSSKPKRLTSIPRSKEVTATKANAATAKRSSSSARGPTASARVSSSIIAASTD